LGIINTLSLSVSESTREIGLMRAVGMSRLGIAGTITIESVLITIFGALTGIITGCYLGWALLKYLGSSGINTISIPWPT
ncbi:FtsX-like permease family protein, partial [Aerococcus urinae]|uniref:FtsX-like permease family protein n=1 Tax=Aerococcus urinae TaxID=1376 RepID=UPI00254EB98E